MRTFLIAVAALLAGVPAPAVGQKPASWIDVEARVGYVRPVTDLGRTAVLRSQGYVAFRRAEPGPLFGAAVSARVRGPLSLRLSTDYAPETGASGQWSCAPFVACPAVLILVDGQVRRWSVAVDLQYRPRGAEWPVEPVLFVGVGRRNYRVRWDSPLPEVPIPTAFSETDWYVRPGAGVSRQAGPITVFLEMDASIGAFGSGEEHFIEGSVPADRRTQVDVGLAVGVRRGIGRRGGP